MRELKRLAYCSNIGQFIKEEMRPYPKLRNSHKIIALSGKMQTEWFYIYTLELPPHSIHSQKTSEAMEETNSISLWPADLWVICIYVLRS